MSYARKYSRYTLKSTTFRSSPVPQLNFMAHIGFYCWYNATVAERKDYGLPAYIALMLGNSTRAKCKAFARETIYPVLGPSPTDAISRILIEDKSLTGTLYLKITMDLVLHVIDLQPSILRDGQDAQTLFMALATVAQRYECQCSDTEDPTVPDDVHRDRCQQISLAIFRIIW